MSTQLPTVTSSPPIYISTVKLKKAFEILSTRSLTKIEPTYLASHGFSESDASQTVGGLKFLKMVDEDGSATPSIRALALKGEERKVKLQEIIKEAYKALFNTIPEVNKLAKDELYNEFIATYRLSPRLARTATPAFLWLCQESGLEVAVPLVVKEFSQNNKKKPTTKKQPVGNHNPEVNDTMDTPARTFQMEGLNPFPIPSSGVIVLIPPNLATKWAIDGSLSVKLKAFEVTSADSEKDKEDES